MNEGWVGKDGELKLCLKHLPAAFRALPAKRVLKIFPVDPPGGYLRMHLERDMHHIGQLLLFDDKNPRWKITEFDSKEVERRRLEDGCYDGGKAMPDKIYDNPGW